MFLVIAATQLLCRQSANACITMHPQELNALQSSQHATCALKRHDGHACGKPHTAILAWSCSYCAAQKKRKVYAVRHHDGSLCTQKQPKEGYYAEHSLTQPKCDSGAGSRALAGAHPAEGLLSPSAGSPAEAHRAAHPGQLPGPPYEGCMECVD